MRSTQRAVAALICAASLVALPSCHGASAGASASDDEAAIWFDPAPAPEAAGLGVRAGKPWRLSDERGKVVVLSFGYTSCVDVCPDTFLKAEGLFDRLGARASDAAFVYVTVDPDRDTPALLRSFLATVDARFEGLYIEGDALASVLSAYGVQVRKRLPDPSGYANRHVDPAGYYTMDHTAGFWIVDRRGRLRARYGHEASADALTRGVRRLVEEAP